MKCKVIEFIPCLQDGGAETLVKDYCRLIDKEKFDISTLVLYDLPNTANSRQMKDNHIKVMTVYKKWNLIYRAVNKLFPDFYIKHRLIKIINEEKPDVIHIHLDLLKYLYMVIDYLKDIRIIYTCHCPPDLFFTGRRKDEYPAAKALLKSNSLQFVALHDEMREDLNRRFEIDNTLIIKNGVDFNRFRNIEKCKNLIRNDLGIPEDAFVIGHVGRFAEQKNHKMLISIFTEVLKKKPNAFLLLIGNGSLIHEIEDLIIQCGVEKKCMILSHRSDIPELLHCMDVFVFPSLFEGLSVTMVEAQASGLRCIASDRISKQTILSKRTITLSLEAPLEDWVRAITDENMQNNDYYCIDDYDINREIKIIESLYSSSYNRKGE